ncbi:tryptophan-rich sensory protein [Tumidithrix helvetica]|uniref:tryptophan-rich sensory protein n=1 Tax=Tumidithrix helvetica TaxID=3457545 RepID=UPI003CC60C7D
MKLTAQRYSNSDRLRQLVTLAAILGSIAVNTISNLFPLNGVNIGVLSNTLFTSVLIIPANYAFAIWGLIYIGLIAFGIYQFQPSQRQNPSLQRCGYLLVFASLAQCVWIYLFLARLFPLSLVAMLGILFPLIGMYQRLGIGQQRISRQERWFIHIPISVYLGWITVATVVNVAIALYSLNWNGWGIAPPIWTAIVMTISTAIAVLIVIKHHDTAYALVMIWALVAIAIRQINTPLIAMTGVVMASVLVVISATSMYLAATDRPKKRKNGSRRPHRVG